MEELLRQLSEGVMGLRPLDIVFSVIVVAVGLFVSRLITRFVRVALGDSSAANVSIVVNTLRAIIGAMVIDFVCENVFHVELTGLMQTLGITTLVISLGLQDLVKNVAAGIQIVVAKHFSRGDQLEMEGFRGEVMDISWRQTMLRDKDGNLHTVPSASIMGGTYMQRLGKMVERYTIECDIKPGLDLDRVAADIEQLADETLSAHGWKAEEPAEVRFVGSTANGVRASIRIFLSDIEYTTRGMDTVMRAIGRRGYLADWTNEDPEQEKWR